jgi:hypothetical protein
MRRQVLASSEAAAATAPRKKADGGLYKTAIFTFLAVYLVGQLVIILSGDSAATDASGKKAVVRNAVRFSVKEGSNPGGSWDSILSAGRGSSADSGVVSESIDPASSSADEAVAGTGFRSHTSHWVAPVSSVFVSKVTDGGKDFEWSSLDVEPAYPKVAGNEESQGILAARPELEKVGQDWEAEVKAIRQTASDAARVKGEDPEKAAADAQLPPRGDNHIYDAMSITTGHPCWQSPRLLYAMGLDSMAETLSGAPPPRDIQRARAEHAMAPVANNLFCSFHSTPIQGGLQCCCHSNLSVSMARAGETSSPRELPKAGGTFFCLPSMVFAGARNTGVGRLYALFHQHAYMVTAPSPPPHAFSSVTNRMLVDGVMPRYVAHFEKQTPRAWQELKTFKERNSAVESKFSVDASPSYFYGINVSGGRLSGRVGGERERVGRRRGGEAERVEGGGSSSETVSSERFGRLVKS